MLSVLDNRQAVFFNNLLYYSSVYANSCITKLQIRYKCTNFGVLNLFIY